MIPENKLSKIMERVGKGDGLEASLKAEGIEPTDAVMKWLKDNHKQTYKGARESARNPKSGKKLKCEWK